MPNNIVKKHFFELHRRVLWEAVLAFIGEKPRKSSEVQELLAKRTDTNARHLKEDMLGKMLKQGLIERTKAGYVLRSNKVIAKRKYKKNRSDPGVYANLLVQELREALERDQLSLSNKQMRELLKEKHGCEICADTMWHVLVKLRTDGIVVDIRHGQWSLV